MPRITVNEIDSSRYVSPTKSAPMVVLVPGTASFGPVFSATSPAVSTFVGADALADFYRMYGDSPACVEGDAGVLTSVEGDGSFEYATNLLRSGATIQFYRLNSGKKATSADGKVSAKYDGRFGNHLVVKIEAVGSSTTDAVLYIYKSKTAFEEKSTTIDVNTLTELYNTRVSANTNSEFYVDGLDLPYVEIKATDLAALIAGEEKTINLFGGLDFAVNGQETDTAATELVTNLAASFENFADPYLFDFDFITSGGIVLSTDEANKAIHLKMRDLALARKDCEAILDTAAQDKYTDVITYIQDVDFNTSYCAFYAPWATIVSATTGKTVLVPPSLLFMKAILLGMQSQTEAELWYVPAGVSRASAPFIVSPAYEIGSTILDEFQNKYKYRVNPIMKLRNYGYCVYGNATALHAEPGVPHSALESLNVRLISNVVKKYIFEVCSGLSFDYNNSTLWLKFYSKMDEKLLYMKRHYGLYDYKIQMDSSTVTKVAQNERRVPGKIIISPTLAGEYFDIDFEIAPSGVTFGAEGENN